MAFQLRREQRKKEATKEQAMKETVLRGEECHVVVQLMAGNTW
jgi:hypothetical protein